VRTQRLRDWYQLGNAREMELRTSRPEGLTQSRTGNARETRTENARELMQVANSESPCSHEVGMRERHELGAGGSLEGFRRVANWEFGRAAEWVMVTGPLTAVV